MLKKSLNRLSRKKRIRAKIHWTATRPRLAVFRSNVNISAQLIDDDLWKTLCSASDIKSKNTWTKVDSAKSVWLEIAKLANWIKLTEVVFDRWGFIFQWRVKALADWAKEAWLKF
jgi:large subunit ribosomal protein L18